MLAAIAVAWLFWGAHLPDPRVWPEDFIAASPLRAAPAHARPGFRVERDRSGAPAASRILR